ncbi:MAG: type II toxin-antitoxin system HicB family antitoxin [Sulfuritalea sp.]|nr:type II toxin-antitoxin system HicB family antitoxin [Sulfuritalea sp.]
MSESPKIHGVQVSSSAHLDAHRCDTDDNESAHRLHFVVSNGDDAFVARCLEVEVASDGSTEAAAVANLREALELYFEDRITQLAELPCRTYRLGQVVIRPTHP